MSALRCSRALTFAAASLVTLAGGGAAAQQSALSALPERAPEVAPYRIGPVLVQPKLSVPEMGSDSNVFNESTAPKDDYVIKLVPEVEFFSELGLLSVAARSGSTFTYFHRYDSERSIDEQVRGRVTLRLSRVRPWVGGASVRSNERTAEVDARARRVEREAAAGLHFDISPLATFTVSGNRFFVRYDDREQYREVALAPSLDRTTDRVSAALRFQATPFTSLTFRGYTSRDVFELDRLRDSRARGGDVELNFGPEAVIRGTVAVGFRQQDSDDPMVATFTGVTGRGAVTAILLWRALIGLDYVRDVQYSVDRRDGYFLETSTGIVYTQRVGGPFDVQTRVARNALDYDASEFGTPRTEVLWAYQGGLGYSLESGSRFGISYELAERDGGLSERQFTRRRIFASFTYEFWK